MWHYIESVKCSIGIRFFFSCGTGVFLEHRILGIQTISTNRNSLIARFQARNACNVAGIFTFINEKKKRR